MSMHKRISQIQPNPSYAAGSAITPVNLATDPNTVMTRLTLDYDIHLNVAAGPVYNTMALPKCTWNALSVTGGGDLFVNLSKPMLLLAKNLRDAGVRIIMDATSTTVSADTTFRLRQVIHFGSFSRDPWDLSAGIICNDFSQGSLQLAYTWPANSVPGTNITIDNTTVCRVVQHLVTFDSAAELNAQRPNIAKPSFYDDTILLSNYSTNASGFDSQYDLPTGQFLRATNVLLTDSGAAGTAQAPDDTRINQIGFLGSGSSDRKITAEDWIAARNRSQVESDAEMVVGNTPTIGGVNVGMVKYDFQKMVDPAVASFSGKYGLDLTHEPKGNFYLGFSVQTANGTLQFLHEKLLPGGWA